MSEPSATPNASTGTSAGALLRAARERQGLHIAALAAAVKIPQRKLEALENDRLDELPDATFARALALTVCRALKIDAAPVLAQLPQLGGVALADVAGGLNAPFRDRAGRSDALELGLARHPLVWAAGVVLVAAAALFVLPAGWWQSWMSESPASLALPPLAQDSAAPAAEAASVVAAQNAANMVDAAASAPLVDTAASAPLVDAAATAASAPAVEIVHSVPVTAPSASAAVDVAAGVVLLRASKASWVEVIDANGQVLVRRVLEPGENLGLNGSSPFKLRIGNAAATQLQFRGEPVDLKPSTRDNIARLELK